VRFRLLTYPDIIYAEGAEEMANGKYERIGRELVKHGSIIDIYSDRMSLPDGREENWDFIDHLGAAAVVAVRDDGRILMVRQFRTTVSDYTLELPAGKRDRKGEASSEIAARELSEETGYKADKLELLVGFYTTIAFCNEQIDVYLATGLHKGEQHLDSDEFLSVETYTPEELEQMIYSGKIIDAKTIAGILAYLRRK